MADIDESEAKFDTGKTPMYLGPYEHWIFGEGKDYAFPAFRGSIRYITALAEFPPKTGGVLMNLGGPGVYTDDVADAIDVDEGDEDQDSDHDGGLGKVGPKTWHLDLWDFNGRHFLPFVVENGYDRDISVEKLQRLLRHALHESFPAAERIKKARFRVAFPVAEAAMNTASLKAPAWSPDESLRDRIGDEKRITIMAVIDDGLPFAHRNFRDATGKSTRIEFCWLQSAEKEAGADGSSVRFGREYTRNAIEDYIGRFGDDEETLYREAGAASGDEELGAAINRHGTHGAHVMDIAAGCAQHAGLPPTEDIRLIAVQLPNTIAWDTSGFGKDMYMLAAFHYIFERASRIAEGYAIDGARLVINFSYGFSGGRHDGGMELEAAIEEMIEARRRTVGPTALILPAGNMFLERLHGALDETDFATGEAAFLWRIQPNDRTLSYLELWFPEGFAASGYAVDLLSPTGEKQAYVDIEPSRNHRGGDDRRIEGFKCGKERDVGQISADYHRNSRWRALIVMAPTEPSGGALPGIDAGAWTVLVRRTNRAKPLPGPIQCWIQRDADPHSLRSGGRQSYFDDPHDIPYDQEGRRSATDVPAAFVRRFGSLNGLATGRRSLVVAGYRPTGRQAWETETALPAAYSSAGRLPVAHRDKSVACAAISDRSEVTPGTVAAGVRSGSLSLVQGTSAAAPFVARQLAVRFATAADDVVLASEPSNYLALLSGWPVQEDEGNIAKARLGTLRVSSGR